ncbi:MAG: hypothetical protein HIU86_14720 [Acidobacteria bacterium]|nr:hypothetical protein [Acidobacteriota bacterium]
MTDDESVTLETAIPDEEAEREIAKAVSARHSIARRYVMRLRRRHPDATPAELIRMLERHYTTAISTTGAALKVGGIAASVGISLIPGGGTAAVGARAAGEHAARKAGEEVAKVAVKQAAKTAAKGAALGAAKTGAQRVAGLLPAGDQQLQFELTAIFGLALADIHGLDYDKEQARALVYGLTNERVSQQQIAKMAADVAHESAEEGAATREHASHWATTLADALPGGAAQSLVRTMQTGHLDTVRAHLSGKQQAGIDYGVAAVAGGITRFVFGREVIKAARAAFPEPPEAFPARLEIAVKPSDDGEHEPNRALAALEDAAKAGGSWIAGVSRTVGGSVAHGAAAVGSGVASVAGSATRVFRAGDPDAGATREGPRALTAVKGAGGAVAGVATAAGGRVAWVFKRGSREDDAQDPAHDALGE